MSQKKAFVLALFVAWAALFIWSYYASSSIEGARNIDTGFRRLDTLIRFQIAAFGFALVAGALGFVWREEGNRILLIGLLPLLTTLVLVATMVVGALVFTNRQNAAIPTMPPKPTAPVAAPADQ